MKIPETPPHYTEIIARSISQQKVVSEMFSLGPTDEKGRYQHWEEMKYREPPPPLNLEEWWAGTKLARRQMGKNTDFLDKNGVAFTFSTPDSVLKELHWLDQNSAGRINIGHLHPSHRMGEEYIVNSFIAEAISSSQIEGATTTRRVAKEMLREGRKPKDKSERMIYNNYLAMEFIKEHKNDDLSPAIVFQLHEILTRDTMDNPNASGVFRTSDDISVWDERDNTELHRPPKARELPERMIRLCTFANKGETAVFMHPVIRAIILHFMIAYDHPFEDGNGRTARALFYWIMLRNGYWLAEYISISTQIKKKLVQYGRSFLYTETDENDLTYFIVDQVSIIHQSIEELQKYLIKKESESQEAIKWLQSSPKLASKLNFRQISLLRHAVKNPGYIYTIIGHKNTHGVSHQTARNDLFQLSDDLKLLLKDKSGKSFVFIAPKDLNRRIKEE